MPGKISEDTLLNAAPNAGRIPFVDLTEPLAANQNKAMEVQALRDRSYHTGTQALGTISGLGTGVATALALAVGTAGSFLTNGEAGAFSTLTTTGKVGIGTAVPSTVQLHVSNGTLAGAPTWTATDRMILESASGTTNFQFYSAANASGALRFSRPGTRSAASILYDHSIESFVIESALGKGIRALGGAYTTDLGNMGPRLDLGTAPLVSANIQLVSPFAGGGSIAFGLHYDGTDVRWEHVQGSGSGYGGFISFDQGFPGFRIQGSTDSAANGAAATVTDWAWISSTGINSTAIGATTPASGAFTTLSTTGAVAFGSTAAPISGLALSLTNTGTSGSFSLTNTSPSASNTSSNIVLGNNDGALLANGDRMGSLVFFGNNGLGATNTSNVALIGVYANENWTTSAYGTRIDFDLIANGSMARGTVASLSGNGFSTNRLFLTNNGSVLSDFPVANARLATSFDGQNLQYVLAYGGNPAIIQGVAGGTKAAPTGTAGSLAIFAGMGYDTTNGWGNGSGTSSSRITMLAAETFSATGHGSHITFDTTPVGLTVASRAERMRIASDGKVGIGATVPTSRLTVSDNVTEPSAITSGNIIAHFVAPDSTTVGRINFDTFGAHGTFSMRRANGTNAAKTALLTDELIGGLSAFGHNGVSYVNSGYAQFGALENWTSTSTPTGFTIGLAPSGSLLATTVFRFTGAGQFGIGTIAPTAPLTVNQSTFTLPPAPPSSNMLAHFVASDSTTAQRLLVDTFGVNGSITTRRANGTNSSKTALLASQFIGGLSGIGYRATDYYTSGYAQFITAENWSDTAAGTSFTIGLTPKGSVVQATAFQFTSEGCFVMYNRTTVPAAIGTGGVFYIENGALKFIGGSGTITTVAPA